MKALKEAGRVAKRKVFVGVMNSLSWNCLYRKSMGFFRESIFRYVKFYNIWDLKSYIKTAYGDAPLTWHCIPGRASMFGRTDRPLTERWDIKHCPFGSFIGLSATILYRFRTEQHPLKVRLKKAEQSVVRGASMKNLNRMTGSHRHERSLSL